MPGWLPSLLTVKYMPEDGQYNKREKRDYLRMLTMFQIVNTQYGHSMIHIACPSAFRIYLNNPLVSN